ncbi:hypothetical protein KBTX_02508 [wastewater metagenome]|uniref:Spermatogenesis-associated protein 20-like TRX domain-containing protein n=4 Tax=root TaxID=1 RepID=A0A5B8RE51_9ZZZZ|nr:thioredoxin domain-containing protein [Arhodomonas aquaeolei]QEA06178.1 hypothetical protein KBTEX_02508 [uncultured organism]
MATTGSNELAREASLYLRQHADNPVHWHPWGEAALAEARERDCPILLSIGYSACHWCHVMAHECFESPEIAAAMNEGFVCIKVDREERPDLDRIYQTAHQLLNGRGGGWPLTVFLTPEQVPFFAGTYFPPDARHGLPGFGDILARVSQAWQEQRDAIDGQNTRMIEALKALQQPPEGERCAADEAAGRARDSLGEAFDPTFGGFGEAPKFPQPAALGHLLGHYARRDDRDALHMVCQTLQRMGLGGIFDQVGGGFARYSVDRYWMIPHFEKMLYDNALLVGLYADAWRITGDGLFARVIGETVDWLMREMQCGDGGFASALDADTPEGEGAYYLWTPETVREALPAEDATLTIHRFGLNERANFHGRWHLHVHATFSELAPVMGASREQIVSRWAQARERLQAVRAGRTPPARDDKRLTGWNALTARGLAHAGRLMGRQEWVDTAAGILGFIDDNLWADGRLLARYADGSAALPAYLDDHAYLLWALLTQLEARWEPRWLERARTVADLLLARFEAPGGGFHFTADDHEPLIQRPYGFSDDALPSGTAIAVHGLQRLADLTGEAAYRDAARRGVDAAAGAVARAPEAHCTMIDAMLAWEHGEETVLIRADGTDAAEWRHAGDTAYTPGRQVFVLPTDDATGLGPAAGARVCTGTHCLPEAGTPEALADLLRG